MFFRLICRNSSRERRENGIYFTALIAAIVAFYIILSLEQQDVMIFLKTMESDAVERLLQLIPVAYGVSLVLIFFLIYFANRYQMDRRGKNYGLYLMFGMRKGRLFQLLLTEDLVTSLSALLTGLPIAVLLSEIIGLATSRLVGLGIIGHHFSVSWKAVLLTVAGFIGIKILALFLLSGKIVGREILPLLKNTQEEKQLSEYHANRSKVQLLAGGVLLLVAYGMAIIGLSWTHLLPMTVTVVFGIAGTFLLFHGLGGLLNLFQIRRPGRKGLRIFTFRQLQENVFLQASSLAVSSLLVLLTLVCISFGITMSLKALGQGKHTADFTFTGEEDKILSRLSEPDIKAYKGELFEVQTGLFFTENEHTEEGSEHTFDASEFLEAVKKQPESDRKNILLHNLQYFTSPYLISLTGYNQMLSLAGMEPIHLENGEVMLYHDSLYQQESADQQLLQTVLQSHPTLFLDGKAFRMCEQYMTVDLVVDRSITFSYALIVTEEDFQELLADNENISSFWNMSLSEDVVSQKGLMQAINEVIQLLEDSEFQYESYLQTIGRQLFYLVGSGYLTVYLAVIFLLIANTVMGVQFLMQQKKTGKRYQTLASLGSSYQDLCHCARTQIRWYFGLPIIVAAASSILGIPSFIRGFTSSAVRSQGPVLFLSALVVLTLICLMEQAYIMTVMRMSDQHLASILELRREES